MSLDNSRKNPKKKNPRAPRAPGLTPMKQFILGFLLGATAAATGAFAGFCLQPTPYTPQPRSQPAPPRAPVTVHTPATPALYELEGGPVTCHAALDNMPMAACGRGDPACVCR